MNLIVVNSIALFFVGSVGSVLAWGVKRLVRHVDLMTEQLVQLTTVVKVNEALFVEHKVEDARRLGQLEEYAHTHVAKAGT